MERNKNNKENMKVKDKIFDGFLQGIGALPLQLITIFVGSLFGVYIGGKPIVKGINDLDSKRDSIYSETLARWDTISYKVNSNKDFDKAKKYELDGFHSLIEKKYGEAIWNFMMSENSVNGYHASYDIAEYLRNHENSLSKPTFWNDTYDYIIKTYWGFIPNDILTEMKKSINFQN